MSKTRDTGFLGNVVKYDANGNVTIVNGATTLLSVSSSGQLTVPGSEVITGSLTVLGGITGAITGSATSASYAANTSLLNNSGSGEFVPTGSFNTFSSSVLTYTGSVNSQLSALQTTSGSNITRLGALESASGSAITRLGALEVTSGSNITRISALETASGSAITRLSSLESRTGSYATTGSNTFVGGQYLSSSFNPTGFSTTASLYTDGGLRVTRDAYISGTLYLNNVTVFGTQSVSYISSSQLNIGTNIISVNTDTPSVRFGGLAVYDSGSTGLTGSMLWDSQDNQWIYSNPSGSTYDSAMFLVGPRNTGALGGEVGINCNFLSKGNGMHHMTSSGIFEDGSRTCFYGNSFISSSGAACFASDLQVGGIYRDFAGEALLQTNTSCITLIGTSGAGAAVRSLNFLAGNNSRLCISTTGIATFTCQVCSPTFAGGTAIFGSGAGTCINITTNGNNGTSGSPLQTSLNFRGLNNNLNGQIRVDDISGTIQIGAMQFYTWNGAQVSALTLCHNASAVFYGTVSAPTVLASGCIGINETSPSSPLHFSKQTTWGTSTNRIININNTGTGGDINQPHNMGSITWYSGNDTPTAEIAAYRNTPASGNNIELRFLTATAGTPLERMRITSTGNIGINTTNFGERLNIGCGSAVAWQNTCNCQKWHIQYNSADGLNFVESAVADFRLFLKAGGNVGIGTSTPSDKLQVLGSLRWGGSTNNVVSSNDGSGVYIEISGTSTATRRLRLQGINDAGNKYSQFFINAGAGEMCFVTEDVQRLLIGSNGVANFSNIVCSAGFSTSGFLRAHNTMRTFALSKNFGERESDANYFRISSNVNNGYQVMVYSVAQNGSVGWIQSQLFQAATAPYWGGWVGTSGAISTIGSGAGYINSAVIGNDGTITFRVSTGNNGTTTTGTILSYIQVTAFNIDNISLTAL